MNLSPRQSTWRKVRWIFLPWLLSMLGIGVGVAALAHFLVLEEGRYTVDSWFVYIPGLVGAGSLYALVLHRRIRLLELSPGGEDMWRGFFHLVVVASLCLSVLLCLRFAQNSMGTVVKLHHPSEGIRAPRVQYYTLDSYYLDRRRVVEFETLTKENQGRGAHLQWVARQYFAMPILDAARDTLDSICTAWLCWHDQDRFPYNDGVWPDSSIAQFQRNARARFDGHTKRKLIAFEAVTDDKVAWWYESAIEKSTHYRSRPYLRFHALTDTVDRLYNKALVELIVYWVLSSLLVLGMVMLPDWNAAEVKRFLARRNKAG